MKGSNGATLSGGKVNVTKEGEVEFRKLNVDIEGNFTLKFYIDGGEEGGGMTGGEVRRSEERSDELRTSYLRP